MKSNVQRKAEYERTTKETSVKAALNIDGQSNVDITTGIGFLDHVLTLLAFHAGWDLKLKANGDLTVDDHHTAEDCAITLGQALRGTLGDRTGTVRFASSFAALEDALARTVIDLADRPYAHIDLGLRREKLGELSCENIPHVFRSLAMSAGFTLHVDVLRGENDHHRAEAAVKALALAFRQAAVLTGKQMQSTKGSL